MMMGPRRIARAIPTITDSFALAFLFFALSDLHQILREPTIDNLLRVLTSLQITANSPFDYPAFLFMGLFALNLGALAFARLRSVNNPPLCLPSIPLVEGPLNEDEARRDVLMIANALRTRALESGIRGLVTMASIESTVRRRSLEPPELSVLRRAVSPVLRVDPPEVGVDRSPLTALLLRATARLGLPVAGLYHPLQNSMSLNPRYSALTQAYAYVHEEFHSLGLDEAHAEIGTLEVLVGLGRLDDLPMGLLAYYLLFRSAARRLEEIGGMGKMEDKLEGLSYGSSGFRSSILRTRDTAMEREIYRLLKSADLRCPPVS